MLDVPVVLIAFNRPDKIRRTLERVRGAQPKQVFLLVDAPRDGRDDDAEKCAAVRKELDAIDWDCQVRERVPESNLGCEANIETGLDWVFSQVDRAIILEDDCMPDPSFFPYAAELLERYADDERIWQVSGSVCDVPKHHFGDNSYAFSRQGAVWGWATWARAWKAHRAVFTRDHATHGWGNTMAPQRAEPIVVPADALATPVGRKFYQDVADTTDGNLFSWDAHFWLTIVASRGYAISPAVNMVENIGMGADATHTATDKATAPAGAITFPLKHPSTVDINEGLEIEQELNLVRGQGRLARFVGKVVGRGRLREALSRMSNSQAAWKIMRAAATVSARLKRR